MLPCPVMGNPIRDQSPTGRYTVSEAAGVLGISVEAVRGRAHWTGDIGVESWPLSPPSALSRDE